METEHRLVALALSLWMGAALGAPAAQGGIKCWTNREGIRECGNAVPSEYAQQGHEVYSPQGVQIGQKGRAKTPEELAEEERHAAVKAEQKRKADEAVQSDRVLLQTFMSEDDMILARDGKIAAIDGQIRLLESQIHKFEADLERRLVLVKTLEKRGQKPAKQILDDIESARAEIETNKTSIETKRREQETLRRRFDQDIERFRRASAEQ
jgi:hypothetical protein